MRHFHPVTLPPADAISVSSIACMRACVHESVAAGSTHRTAQRQLSAQNYIHSLDYSDQADLAPCPVAWFAGPLRLYQHPAPPAPPASCICQRSAAGIAAQPKTTRLRSPPTPVIHHSVAFCSSKRQPRSLSTFLRRGCHAVAVERPAGKLLTCHQLIAEIVLHTLVQAQT